MKRIHTRNIVINKKTPRMFRYGKLTEKVKESKKKYDRKREKRALKNENNF
jgi:hypothetical protein